MELFFSDDIDGRVVRLDPEESGHCVRVLRHREGDEISVTDGRGNLHTCILMDADPKSAVAEIRETEAGFGTHPYHLTMAVCPTKNNDRFEWFVEKATEIGVDVIAPVIGEHSERKVYKTDRACKIVLSAVKQSLKGVLPAVSEPVSVRRFLAGTDPSALNLICYCSDDVSERRDILDALASSSSEKISILIGPEGDFSREEVSLALEKGWVAVSLGDSRLRTETAAVVAATAVYLNR